MIFNNKKFYYINMDNFLNDNVNVQYGFTF
jgi:hypothetical protein